MPSGVPERTVSHRHSREKSPSGTKRIFDQAPREFCGAEQVRSESGLRYAAMSDQGRRERNEDAYFAGEVAGYHVFAVADGLGGHASGDVASRMAVAILEETAGEGLGEAKPATVLERAFQHANFAVYTYNRDNHLNAATTLSAAIVSGSGRCWIGTVGDSRTHIITPSSVWHTRDQSYVQDLVDAGVLSPAEAIFHPKKNILTRALGLEVRVQVDLDERNIAGSVLVMSSDGLHDYVPESVIQGIAIADDPGTACRRLIDAAKNAASTDNITVIVARE